jgi:hypothetical protein
MFYLPSKSDNPGCFLDGNCSYLLKLLPGGTKAGVFQWLSKTPTLSCIGEGWVEGGQGVAGY